MIDFIKKEKAPIIFAILSVFIVVVVWNASRVVKVEVPDDSEFGTVFRITRTTAGGTATSTQPTADQILIGGDTANAYDVKTLTAGTNITIATSSGLVTISSTGGGGTGSVGTSTADVDTHIAFFTSNSATPALIGGEAAFTYDDATNILTVDSIISSASSTLDELSVRNGTTTNATSTNLHISSGLFISDDNITDFAGTGLSVSGGVLNSHVATVDTNLTEEEVEDFAGALIASSSGTHTRLTVTYQDATSDIDFVVDADLSNYSNASSLFFDTAGTNISNTGSTINVDDAFLVNDANDTTTGILTVTGIDLTTNGNRIDTDTDNDTSIRSANDDELTFEIGAVDTIVWDSTSYRFNDTTIDRDFIIDGDGVLNLVHVNAGTDRVGIASSTPMSIFGVAGTTTTETLNIDDPDHTGTSTIFIYSGTSGFGGEVILEDEDGAGCTSITALNGTINGQTVTCPTLPVAN